MAVAFIPGIELSRRFYAETVRPILAARFAGLPHSAALIGWGSEVLGFDSARSTDHNWGPRLQIFLSDADEAAGLGPAVASLVADRLPAEFLGYPTVFPASEADRATASHWVTVAGLRSWLTGALGFDPTGPIGTANWLAVPSQVLAEVTGGAVFHDGLTPPEPGPARPGETAGTGALTAVRAALEWYPRDVWHYVLACQWQRIAQEEPFPGRCAEAGDELGSAIVTARLARDLIRLALLLQRRYPPYSKWLGTALARTGAAAELTPLLTAAIAATRWADRKRPLAAALASAARLQNQLAIIPPLDPAVRPTFYDRPYPVLGADRFVSALRAGIGDQSLRARPLTGAADQFIDSTDAIGDLALLRAAIAAG